MKQRLFIAAAAAIGAACWLLAIRFLAPSDGGSGLTLIHAHTGVITATIITLLLAVPAVLCGLIVSATGNPLAGVFTAAMALLILAAAGGPIDGWLLSITGPSAYRGLAFEMVLWLIGVTGVMMLIQISRPKLREAGLQSNAVKTLFGVDHSGLTAYLNWPTSRGLGAGAVCALVGGVVAMVLIRSSESGQVIGSLLVAFTIGGVCGQMVLPRGSSPVVMLLAPGAVAIAAYMLVATGYTSHDQLLTAWFAQTRTGAGFSDRLLSLALALPIHYASAGVAGAAMGVGLGQSIQAAQLELGETA